MFAKIRVIFGISLFLFIAVPANAATLWHLQVGQVWQSIRTDSLNNSWNVELTILGQEVRDSQTYFHARQWNYRNDGQLVDWYFRSTEDAVYFWGSGGENALIRSGAVGETWTVGDEVTTIMDPEQITVPYGGPYTAVVNRKNKVGGSPYWYEYVVPEIGWVQEVDYYTDNAPKINQLVSISTIPPAEFDANSANITNQYTPFGRLGTRLIRVGCKDSDYESQLWYLDAAETEEVFGIKCLKGNVVYQGQLFTIWLAQDTSGTVWAVKFYFHGAEKTYSFGNGIISPFMPAIPAVGNWVGHTFPESDDYHCEITETGIDLPENCWGMGPFSGCVKVQCGHPPLLSEEDPNYYCPGFGPVSDSSTELKEIVSYSCTADLNKNGVVDGFDLATFAAEFGSTCE
jgi:hypothetical protein